MTAARARPRLALWIVFAALAFAPVLGAGFVDWDDREMVVRNPILAPGHFADVLGSWTRPTLDLYSPVTYTAYGLLAAVGRGAAGDLDPVVFHAANLLLHTSAGVLVLLLLRRLGGDDRSALVGALLWTVHPIQAEPVAWVASLNTCLCVTLAIAALLLQATAWTAATRRRRNTLLAAAALTFVLSLCAKPASVGLPLVLLGLNRFVLRRPWRETMAVAVVAGVLALPFVLAGAAAQPPAGEAVLTAGQRLAVVGHAFAFYLYKTAVPFGYTIDYGLSPDVVLAGPWLRYSGLALLPLLGLLVWQARRRPWLAGAACVFVGGIGPVCGVRRFEFQNVSTVADRYAYFALLGLAIAVALGLRDRLRSRGATAAAAAVLGALASSSSFATLKWHDSRTLERATLAANPRSLAALVLQGDRAIDAGDLAAEESVCRRFLDRRPTFAPINQTLASLLLRTDRPGEAIGYFRRALAVRPDGIGYNDLAVALMREHQYAAALDATDAAIARLPGDERPRALRDEILRRQAKEASKRPA